MGYLDSLAQGLRLSGGVLNPQVQQMNQHTELQDQNALRQRQQMLITQAIRAAETGAADPAQVQSFLKAQGVNVPESFVGPDQATQARQQALKNEQGFRDALQANPNASLEERANIASQFGKPEISAQLLNAHEQRQARISTAAQALAQREIEAQRRHDEALARITDAAERRAETERFHKATEARNAEVDRRLEQFGREGLDIKRGMMGILQQGQERLLRAETDRKDRNLQQDTMKLESRIENGKLEGVLNSIDRVNNLLGEYVEHDPNNPTAPFKVKKNVPGVGYGTTLGVSPFANTERGNQNRAAVQAIANDLLLKYSGLAVTAQEQTRRSLDMMSSGKFNEQEFVNSWPHVVEFANKATANLKGGFGPDVIKKYTDQGGVDLSKRTPFNLGKQAPMTMSPAERSKSGDAAPEGVPPELWKVMTPEEKAKFK